MGEQLAIYILENLAIDRALESAWLYYENVAAEIVDHTLGSAADEYSLHSAARDCAHHDHTGGEVFCELRQLKGGIALDELAAWQRIAEQQLRNPHLTALGHAPDDVTIHAKGHGCSLTIHKYRGPRHSEAFEAVRPSW